MKQDLDRYMAAQGIDAIWITGAAQNNPDMVYFTGLHHVSSADLFKIQGQEPILFYNSMEREEAAKTGLGTINYDEKYPIREYYKKAGGNTLQTIVLRYQDIFRDLGIQNKTIAPGGKVNLNNAYAIVSALQKAMPDVTFAGYFNDNVLDLARMTKSKEEIEHIRKMGSITTRVVGNVADYLSSHRVKGNILVDGNGDAITVGRVKSHIRRWLAEYGADNPEETIFAIGRDAGIPHSAGDEDSVMELGKTIVFDIFPCEAGGGYFYDFTRTWCLGHASDDIHKIYDDVFSVHQNILHSIKSNTPFRDYQVQTCSLFKNMGYDTIDDHPGLTEGYVHSLGHGLGLDVHENPYCGMGSSEKDILQEGTIFTIEPGLYYPSKGMGVRIEDTATINAKGECEILAEFPYELVLPVKE